VCAARRESGQPAREGRQLFDSRNRDAAAVIRVEINDVFPISESIQSKRCELDVGGGILIDSFAKYRRLHDSTGCCFSSNASSIKSANFIEFLVIE
jgi:hypothetical protein